MGKSKACLGLAIALFIGGAHSAMAGNICLTGHDVLLHDGQRGYDEVILDYLRGAGTAGEIPRASYSIGVIGSNVGSWGWFNVPGFNDRGTGPNVPPGFLSTTYYDTAALDLNPALQAAALSHDVLVILSHTSCGGCDLSTAGSAVINTQMAAGITAAFNAGMDIWAISGAGLATYYDFLPPAFATAGPPIAGSTGFFATAAGTVMGIVDPNPGNSDPLSMINGFPTHNRFVGFSPLLTVMEIRPNMGTDEVITMCAQDISLSGNLSPVLDFNLPGTDHTVDLQVEGADVEGIDILFRVISGPNDGEFGTDTTDAAGVASFTYTDFGGIGVDEIQAFFDDADGNAVESNIALKFWDEDCQPNGIPDTCDIDCGGFDGRCVEFLGCGGSSDAGGDGVPDECNMPPDCSSALADPDELWPPNHKFREISVVGVTDPDGDPIVITVDSIFQDEPTNTSGDGSSCPDGGVGAGTARVRAERSGNKHVPGDGRVYHIDFTADDGHGGQCTGEVTVCVPHDQRPGHVCIDQGPLFESTVCGP